MEISVAQRATSSIRIWNFWKFLHISERFWHWTPDKEIEVENDTAELYRYFDATPLVAFLYAKVAETVRKDLQEELNFVAIYDAAMSAVRERIDMPDRRAALLVHCLLQNHGMLSKKKRVDFAELNDQEVSSLESAIQRLFDERTAQNAPKS